MNPPMIFGSYVLRRQHRCRLAQGHQRRINERFDFEIRREGSNVRFPCGIDGHLNQHIGKSDAQGLNGDRKTNSKDFFWQLRNPYR